MSTSLSHLKVLASGIQDESAPWLTAIIRELWPYAANIAQSVLLEYVQPALEAAVPHGIPTPHYTKLDIGDDAVVVERVRVVERSYSDGDVGAVLEADIVYDGNPNIELALGEFHFGINDAKLTGRVEILLRPLINRIPLVAAGQIAFINPPKLEYTLTGIAALGNQFLIRDILLKTVNSVIGDMAVLPNRVAYKVVPDTDYFNFAAHPIGVLRVAALRGYDFPATDRHVLKQAVGISEDPDVYLTIKHGNTLFQTKHVNDQTNPVWEGQVFDYVLTSDSSSQRLLIEAYDYDFGDADDFLGSASILVSNLVEQGTSQIMLHEAPENATPSVVLSARWIPLTSDLRHLQHAIISQRSDKLRPDNCSYLLLSIDIDEAHRLPPGKRPYVQVTVGEHKFCTSAKYDSPGMFSVEDPEFEQSCHISLNGEIDASAKICYQILDLYSGEVFGHAFSTLSEAMEAGPSGKTYNFALLKTNRAGASLRVRVKISAVLDQPPLWKVLADSGELQKQTLSVVDSESS